MDPLIKQAIEEARQASGTSSDRELADYLGVHPKDLESASEAKVSRNLVKALNLKAKRVMRVVMPEAYGGEVWSIDRFARMVQDVIRDSGLSADQWEKEHGITPGSLSRIKTKNSNPGPSLFSAFGAEMVRETVFEKVNLGEVSGFQPMHSNEVLYEERDQFRHRFARRLKLKFKEDLDKAAEEIGTSVSRIERVLGSAQMPNKAILSWMGEEKAERHIYFTLDGEQIDDASALARAKAWLQENYDNEEAACQDLGVGSYKLRKMLRQEFALHPKILEATQMAVKTRMGIMKAKSRHAQNIITWRRRNKTPNACVKSVPVDQNNRPADYSRIPVKDRDMRLLAFFKQAKKDGSPLQLKLISTVVQVYQGDQARAAMDMKITTNMLTRLMSGKAKRKIESVDRVLERHNVDVPPTSEVVETLKKAFENSAPRQSPSLIMK